MIRQLVIVPSCAYHSPGIGGQLAIWDCPGLVPAACASPVDEGPGPADGLDALVDLGGELARSLGAGKLTSFLRRTGSVSAWAMSTWASASAPSAAKASGAPDFVRAVEALLRGQSGRAIRLPELLAPEQQGAAFRDVRFRVDHLPPGATVGEQRPRKCGWAMTPIWLAGPLLISVVLSSIIDKTTLTRPMSAGPADAFAVPPI